jgi:hypothetical protein
MPAVRAVPELGQLAEGRRQKLLHQACSSAVTLRPDGTRPSAGQFVRISLSLGNLGGTDLGLNIMDPGFPASPQIACEPLSGPVFAFGPQAGTGDLTYNPSSNTYTYSWRTRNC